MIIHKMNVVLLASIGLIFGSAGCESGLWLFSPADLPADLDWLLGHEAEYTMPLDLDAPDADAATEEELATNLDGCWGLVRQADADIPVKLYWAVQFDAANQRAVLWTLQEEIISSGVGIRILDKSVDTYEFVEIDDGLSIQFTNEEHWLYNPYTGELEKVDALTGGAPMYFHHSTFADDYLYVRRSDEGEWERFKRMDCAE
jgi:hypothetical protein